MDRRCLELQRRLSHRGVAEKNAEAQDKIDEQAKQLSTEASNKIVDMAAAFEAGKEQGRVVLQATTQRGAADVAKYPVFQNPACVLPDESLALLNAARASLRSGILPTLPAAPAPATPTVPSAALPPAPTKAPAAQPPPSRELNHPKPRPIK